MKDKIIHKNLKEGHIEDYTTYSMLTNNIRAIPDIRDGLKTVHRRVIDAMYNHLPCKTKKIKTASIVGKVLQISHPHGDSSVADAISLMATWFNHKEPLLDPQGNFGTITGESAASPRYTEAKLSQYALDCLLDELSYNDNIVDWRPTFTGSDKEPEYLPAKVPNLLINGTSGIGVGIISGIPKHNLAEVIDATLQYMDNPSKPVVLYPDHCLPVDIIDTDFKAICGKGHGKYRARGRIEVVEDRDRPLLIIKTVPDGASLVKIEEAIEGLVEKKHIQVSRIDDKSTENEIHLEIVLKKGVDPYYTRDVLFKSTDMEKSYSVDFRVLIDREPVRIGYKAYLEFFIKFRKMCKLRLYSNIIQHHNTKKHETEAFVKLLQSNKVEEVIKLIRNKNSKNDDELIRYLITKLKITDLQAKYIINAPLKKLSKNNLNNFIQQNKHHEEVVKVYVDKLISDEKILDDIRQELLEMKKKYGKARTSKIISDKKANAIPEGDFTITVTHNNHIKKFTVNQDPQNLVKETKLMYKFSNTDTMVILDSIGKCYTFPVSKISPCDKNGTGYNIMNFIKTLTSDIVAILSMDQLEEYQKKFKNGIQCLFVTDSGLSKKLQLSEFFNIPKSGTTYMRLSDNDFVRHSSFVTNNGELVCIVNNKVLRFDVSDIPTQRRSTKGLNIIKINNPDKILHLKKHNSKNKYIVVTNSGYVNVTNIQKTSRAHVPKNVIKLNTNDSILTVLPYVNGVYKLIGYGNKEYLLDCNQLPIGSSLSKGKKLLSIHNDKIKSIELV